MVDVTPFWVAGQPETNDDPLVVTHPADGGEVGRTAHASSEQTERAVAAAASIADDLAALPAHVRASALDHVARRLAERAEDVARLITAENGKPITWARAEVSRGVATFRWAAEEARRFFGHLQRLDTEHGAEGRLAAVMRVPKGPVLGISPFNFPLNLVAHKVAPALAVGAPIVLKPAPATPLTALLLGSFLAETELPAGAFSILPLPNDRAPALVTDPRLPVVSFTGSSPVGAQIRAAVPDKHVTLELGGNAAAVVCADWSSGTDLARAAQRIATFGMYQAGQSCISVQRVIAHESIYDRLVALIAERVAALGTGDPYDDATVVGPMINEEAAQRVSGWVGEAVAAGARELLPCSRSGATISPTVLTDVPTGTKVWTEEVFGPVLAVASAGSDDEAFAMVNDSAYGLQAGVFTRNIQTAFRANRCLRVGGVIIGDVPSFRADQMPYGGVKASGVGREGVRSAMDDYTDTRVLVLTDVAL